MSEYYERGTTAGVDGLYLRMTSLMTSHGWTLIDTIYNSVDYRDQVFRGAPLDSAAQNYVYVRISWIGAMWSSYCYTDWDTTNHQGACVGLAGSSVFNTGGAPVRYWLRVNEFSATFTAQTSSTMRYLYVGFLCRGLSNAKNGLTRTTQAYAAGNSTLNVASNLTGKLQVNQKVLIYNHGHNSGSANFNNVELLTVQSVGVSSITFTSPTTLAYDSGAVIGWNPCPVIASYMASTTNWASLTAYTPFAHDGYRGSGTGVSVNFAAVIFATEGSVDPDDISQEYLGGVVSAYLASSGRSGFHGYMYHWLCSASPASSFSMEEVVNHGSWRDVVVMPTGTSYVYTLRDN